ncbi:MAG: hypothetical protein R3B83_04665 [Nitrospirales bacterium]|nr:hypothetical protein [Nitrospirales bacterium]
MIKLDLLFMTFSPFTCKKLPWAFVLACILFDFLGVASFPGPAYAASYFEDGFLGLTQEELRQKLGVPMAVRSRKAALRVFSYYSFQEWQKYFKSLVSPENGEDVYTFQRGATNVRYSFVYTPDLNEGKDFPTLYVQRCEIEFTPAVPIDMIPSLVPEFLPSREVSTPAFRSNLWVLLFKGPPASETPFIVKEQGKEKFSWSLAYQMFSVNGIPDPLTLQASIDRLEITAQSLQVVKARQRLTHEPILNPFSQEFEQRPEILLSPKKTIPLPQYED